MIHGIGCNFGGDDDQFESFVKEGKIWVGWRQAEAPAHYQQLANIGVGDIVYIKSFPPSNGLYIKAIGFVTSPIIHTNANESMGRDVMWAWTADDNRGFRLGRIDDHYDNMRRGTLYQEFGPKVQNAILSILAGLFA